MEKQDLSPNLTQASRPPTFGEQLVGVKFNPSNDPDVDRAKAICAELADMVHKKFSMGAAMPSEIAGKLYSHAIGEILNAQMNVVKVLTLQY